MRNPVPPRNQVSETFDFTTHLGLL